MNGVHSLHKWLEDFLGHEVMLTWHEGTGFKISGPRSLPHMKWKDCWEKKTKEEKQEKARKEKLSSSSNLVVAAATL
jgi:hypothetical protein